jgi:hypothetical protein
MSAVMAFWCYGHLFSQKTTFKVSVVNLVL